MSAQRILMSSISQDPRWVQMPGVRCAEPYVAVEGLPGVEACPLDCNFSVLL